jgi:small subunit ribosomal protein S1
MCIDVEHEMGMSFNTVGEQEVPAPWQEEGYWESLLANVDDMNGAPVVQATGEVALGIAQPPDEDAALEAELALLDPESRDWRRAEVGFEQGKNYDLEVTGYNRGGLLVRFYGLTGFVPASHLAGPSYLISETRRQEMLSARVGSTLHARVIELDSERSRLIFSERVAQEAHKPDDALSRLQPNDMCAGVVSNICHFGVFVDLGGVEGLIHISELSWGRVGHPEEVLNPGQQVTVYVIDVDRPNRKVALSLKRMTPDPWNQVEERYHVGQLVDGIVTNVVGFGAFVRLEEGLEGLIHISELAEGSFLHPRNVVQEDSVVTVRVLSIDPDNRRLALSLRHPGTRIHTEALASRPTTAS